MCICSSREIHILTGRGPLQRLGNVHHVGDDGLDAVALALHLSHQARHLVPVIKFISHETLQNTPILLISPHL
jgi:hypothetical protein